MKDSVPTYENSYHFGAIYDTEKVCVCVFVYIYLSSWLYSYMHHRLEKKWMLNGA